MMPRARRPRPFATTYFFRGKARLVAHACTSVGAVRAVTKKLLSGEFDSAEVYTTQGNHIASATRRRNQVTIYISNKF